MRKIKNDLVDKAKKIKKTDVTDDKKPKVDDLAPNVKNLTNNIKDGSKGMVKQRQKPGNKTYVPINPRLKQKK